MGSVRRLRPIRVLLASRDPRFLCVSAFLLGRKGFSIETTRKLGQLPEVIDRRRANVVLLDGTGSLRAAARAADAIQALYPRVAVVLVADETDGGSTPESWPLPKWESFTKIVSEIERAYIRAGLRERLAPVVRLDARQLETR
jgi:DNA-binding NtrC family response regulator